MPKVGSQMSQGYTLANDWIQERDRLRLRESVHDPETINSLNGWAIRPTAPRGHAQAVGSCRGLALPRGRGRRRSIAEWLCQKVGTTGHVVATDLNTRLLDHLEYAPDSN
jgi:hypothetical protein